MGGLDAAFLYGETASWHMHVSTLMIIDPSAAPGCFDFEAVKRSVAERLPLLPQFRWKPVFVPFGLDRPGWVEETNFDPDYHIRRIAVPSPGGRRELGELAGQLTSYKLDLRRPLWELWFIEGVEGGRVATLTKMHHSVVDGVSGMGLVDVILDTSPDAPPRSLEVRESLGDRRMPAALELLALGAISAATRTPIRLFRFSRQMLRQGLDVARLYQRSPALVAAFSAPRTSLNGELTPHRRFTWTSVSLDRARAIKDRYRVKVNDVILALCASALRRYLQRIDDLPQQPLLAQCPVSLRGESSRDAVGNRVGSLYVSLATNVADPVARLRAIHHSTSSAKEMQRALSVHRIMGLTDTTPPGLIGLAARMYTATGMSRRQPPVNVVIANVPGPDYPLYLGGAIIDAMYPMGPLLLGMGLNVTVISYQQALHFGFMCCPELLPDPEMVADNIDMSLSELEKAPAA